MARLTLRFPYERERFRAQINVTNLFNREYFGASYSDTYVLPIEPLMVRGTFEWQLWTIHSPDKRELTVSHHGRRKPA